MIYKFNKFNRMIVLEIVYGLVMLSLVEFIINEVIWLLLNFI